MDRTGRWSGRRQIGRPGAAAVDELGGFDGGGCGLDANRGGQRVGGAHGRVGEELDAGGAHRGEKSRRQLAGIEGVFAQELEAIQGDAGREQLRDAFLER